MMNLAAFGQYIKDLKPTAEEEYVYTVRDNFFGDIILSINTCYIRYMNLPIISDDYMDKMFYTKCIKVSDDDTVQYFGYENNFGVLANSGYTYQYCCRRIQRRMYDYLSAFKADMYSATFIHKINNINQDEQFYNNILSRKSNAGAGRYVLSNITGMNDKVLYIAPCMLPCSKSTPLDLTIYDINGADYFVCVFTAHKKTGDVMTMMRFLNV